MRKAWVLNTGDSGYIVHIDDIDYYGIGSDDKRNKERRKRMISKETTIHEIRDIFKNSDSDNKKDIKVIALSHDKKGRGEISEGISHIKAMDCLFYMILDKTEFDNYALVRNKSSEYLKIRVKSFLRASNSKISIEEESEIAGFFSQMDELSLEGLKEKLKEIRFRINPESKFESFNDIQMSCLKTIIEELYSPTIYRYLAKEFTWCREERQIALFLNNIFLSRKNGKWPKYFSNNIKKPLRSMFGCNLSDIEIHEVFYEAAILRDYFHYIDSDPLKQRFDEELLEFCFNIDSEINPKREKDIGFIKSLVNTYCDEGKKGKSLTGGKKELWDKAFKIDGWINKEKLDYCPNVKKERMDSKDYENVAILQKVYFASMLMNAKPDIILIYSKKDKNENDNKNAKKNKYALLMECKYKSDAGKYKDYRGYKTINQELLQELIMTFLFGKNDKWEKENPLDYYLPEKYKSEGDHDNEREKEWRKVYKFCEEILKNPNHVGLFNKNADSVENRIINKGVVEIDFEHNDSGISDKYDIPAEDLIRCVYHQIDK